MCPFGESYEFKNKFTDFVEVNNGVTAGMECLFRFVHPVDVPEG